MYGKLEVKGYYMNNRNFIKQKSKNEILDSIPLTYIKEGTNTVFVLKNVLTTVSFNRKKKNQLTRIKPVFLRPTGPKALKQNKTGEVNKHAKDKTGQNKTQSEQASNQANTHTTTLKRSSRCNSVASPSPKKW